MTLPAHPMLNCKQGTANDPFCRFEWRIERLDGTLMRRSIDRTPKLDERLVERCARCHKECQP